MLHVLAALSLGKELQVPSWGAGGSGTVWTLSKQETFLP